MTDEDISSLVARDHSELDSLSKRLISTDSRSPAWRSLLDTARLAFAAHVEAEHRALRCRILSRVMTGPLAWVIKVLEDEHHEQARLFELLSYQHDREAITILALDLRTELLAHALDQRHLLTGCLSELLVASERRSVGASYAEERSHALERFYSVGSDQRDQLMGQP